MKAARLNAALIAVSASGLALGLRLVAVPLVRVALPPLTETGSKTAPAPPEVHPESLTTGIMAHDPFRVARRPSDVGYDPVRLMQPVVPPPPKPVLAVVGIVWDTGRDPTALVEGLPGLEGPRAVRRGETVAGLRVRMIEPDRVVITGLDTAWTLRVREPWK